MQELLKCSAASADSFTSLHEGVGQALIGTRKFEKLLKYGLVTKVFLVCLFVSLNEIDKQFVERARVVCLVLLPLMFSDESYRKQVEHKISQANAPVLI